MAVASQLLVGMADIKVIKGGGNLTCLGLGSCIGLIAYDKDADITGMVHIMLPQSFKDKPVDKPGKFVDTGVPELFRQMEKLGANLQRLVIAYGGGAQVFKFGAEAKSRLDVGARNVVALEEYLVANRLKVLSKDVGGASGRTIMVNCDSGEVKVRTVQGGEKILCRLRN